MDQHTLPPPAKDQPFCEVSALEAGHLTIPKSFILAGAGDDFLNAPSLSFIIHHSATRTNIVFDLGVRKDMSCVPKEFRELVRVPQDVSESLAKGGLSPSDIKYVCLSHLHWDHTGDTHLFTNAQFLVGAECRVLFTPGYSGGGPPQTYPPDLLPHDRTKFLSPQEWKPIGPFTRALDFFNDGSLYLIDAPGHLPGHLNLLARTSSDGGWIYLAGDTAHHWNIITGESAVAGKLDEHGHFTGCVHAYKEVAEEMIRRIRVVSGIPKVRVIIAHDAPWYNANKNGNAFWPGKITSL